jgi:hypothetical protein
MKGTMLNRATPLSGVYVCVCVCVCVCVHAFMVCYEVGAEGHRAEPKTNCLADSRHAIPTCTPHLSVHPLMCMHRGVHHTTPHCVYTCVYTNLSSYSKYACICVPYMHLHTHHVEKEMESSPDWGQKMIMPYCKAPDWLCW